MSATILLVDDYREAAEVLALYLQIEHFEVRIALDGEDVLAEAAARPPDLIIMDLEMPFLSGYEVATRLRASAETAHIPLIAVTGHSHPDKIGRAQRAGFDAVIIKPYNPDTLIAHIRRLLDSNSS